VVVVELAQHCPSDWHGRRRCMARRSRGRKTDSLTRVEWERIRPFLVEAACPGTMRAGAAVCGWCGLMVGFRPMIPPAVARGNRLPAFTAHFAGWHPPTEQPARLHSITRMAVQWNRRRESDLFSMIDPSERPSTYGMAEYSRRIEALPGNARGLRWQPHRSLSGILGVVPSRRSPSHLLLCVTVEESHSLGWSSA